MKGWQIFKHSVRQVTGNLDAALRLSGLLYLAQFAVGFLFAGGMAMSMGGAAGMLENGMGAGFALGGLVVLLVAVVSGIWIAVAWHRYVLLGEPSGLLPTFRGDRIWPYFLSSLGYALILIVLGAVWGGIVGFVISGLFSTSIGLALFLMGVLIYLPMLVIGFRLTAALPGVALGADISFLSGWRATEGHMADLVTLALIIVAVVFVLEMIGTLLFGSVVILSLIWAFVMGWLQMMVGVSILTTLYGHYIEKRALV